MKFDRAYFDEIFAKESDPWGLERHFYEARKRAVVLASLPAARYGKAFEPACATGVLTQQLASRCRTLLAADVSDDAVARATRRLRGLGNVTVRQMQVPAQWPGERFDLMVFSEFLYYLAAEDRARLAMRARDGSTEGGTLVACHWKRRIDPAIPLGDALHEELGAALGWPCLVLHEEEDFVVQVWSRDGRSVARREGIVLGD
jgi:hypothetical protein